MFLLIVTTFLAFLLASTHKIAIPIQKFLKNPSSKEKQILEDIRKINKKLSQISVRDEYVQYVKIERQKLALEKDLLRIQEENKTKNTLIDYGLGYAIKFLFSIILFIITIVYRTSPVLVFSQSNKPNFTPFSSFLNFPTGIEGAISVPAWILISSITFHLIIEEI